MKDSKFLDPSSGEIPSTKPQTAGGRAGSVWQRNDSSPLGAARLVALRQKRQPVGTFQTLHDARARSLFRFVVEPNNQSRLKSALLTAMAVLLLCFTSAHAQNFNIDWFSIDGGGGMSTGAVYSVSGTIGQPDAGGRMTGGNYSLAGGFWPGIAVASAADVPALFIQVTGVNSVTVSWLPATLGFVLEQTDSLSSPSWSPAPLGNPVEVPAAGATKFYRLRNP